VRAVDSVIQTQTNGMKEAIAVAGHLSYHGVATRVVTVRIFEAAPDASYLGFPFSRNAGIQTR
jgi:hypothetical protein